MMKNFFLLVTIFSYCTAHAQVLNKTSVEQWDKLEISLPGPSSGNPFTDIWLSAEFSNGKSKVKADGFYDGNGSYKIRFMPGETGKWSFKTQSNSNVLGGKTGGFTCIAPTAKNHGPVKVSGTYDFEYSDGTRYYPFGTTIYAWTHQGQELQEETLASLGKAPFNKVRMCVFPKFYGHNVSQDPEIYPYEMKSRSKGNEVKHRFVWDYTRFNPAFFQHLEKRVEQLDSLGIEADLIIFHPYDKGRWGFDSMGKENDIRYIKYLVARMAAFKNVWWSMANEYDYIRTKPREAWADYTDAVVNNDPYRHLCSIHNGSFYYDNWKPQFTHASIQNGSVVEDFGRAVLLRDAYNKPVIYDEVCYEGDLTSRWGRLTGEEMTEAFWQGMIAGTYVTHGETYQAKGDTIFWARGGTFTGSSPARIGFLRKLIEEGPGPLELADPWKDHHTGQADTNYYMIYFGKEMKGDWQFNLPRKNAPQAGARFKAEIIDTWAMTITPVKQVFELAAPVDYRMYDKDRKKIRLPYRPYLALRLTRVK